MLRSCLVLIVAVLYIQSTCAAQSNRDLLFSETWYTAEGLVMTFDSSGVTWEGVWWGWKFDESTIYYELRAANNEIHRKVVLAHYLVHSDSLVLVIEPATDAHWGHPRIPAGQRNMLWQPKITLYSSSIYHDKKMLENFESFELENFQFQMTLDSDGFLTIRVPYQFKFASRFIRGVYKGSLEPSQIDALKTILRDSGFFSTASATYWDGRKKSFICRTSNGTFKCYLEDIGGSGLVEYVEKIMLNSDAWQRNGMKYYGLEGELVEPVEEIFLAWKPGMPEKPRIAVSGSFHYIDKVSTLNETGHLYLLKVDTVYGSPFSRKNEQQRFKKEIIVHSKVPISPGLNYAGFVLTEKLVQTLTWQSDHTGSPYAKCSYFELQEIFPVDGVGIQFWGSKWDCPRETIPHLLKYEKWPPSNLASSHLEFKVAKAVRKIQGHNNFIRRDWQGNIMP